MQLCMTLQYLQLMRQHWQSHLYVLILQVTHVPLLTEPHELMWLTCPTAFVVLIYTHVAWIAGASVANTANFTICWAAQRIPNSFVCLKDHSSLFLTSHRQQRSALSSTNVKSRPCVYFSRSQTAFLNSIHCHLCWDVQKHYRKGESFSV